MASELLKILKNGIPKHAVGNLNNWTVRTLNQGAKVVGADIDNFTFVELGFDAEGERTCKQLSAKTNKAYLIAGVERYLEYGMLKESLSSFYNAIGERSRIVHLDEGLRFDTSAFSKNTGVTEIKNGMVAHFDVTTKKFIVSDGTTNHADYEGSSVKLLVVDADSATIDGQKCIRLEV